MSHSILAQRAQPKDIIDLAANKEKRLVQNGEQLLDVLIESLRRIEEKLQGERNESQFLWSDDRKGSYYPKDEATFADYIGLRLEDDLKGKCIIINREVKTRRKMGSGNEGEIIDFKINANGKDPCSEDYNQSSVIIEAKGCWNDELKTVMKGQLANRYLKDNQCDYGLYLIGWFDCNQWDKGDYRYKNFKSLHMRKNEIQQFFDAQAAEMSRKDKIIKAFVINCALR
ncbi:MAG: hypothetical protein AB2L14_36550 [Candidatus Xenobiia bacterium LiM19]